MNIFLLIIKFIKAIPAWPLTILAIIFIFRKSISIFIEKITELKFGDIGVSAKNYREVEEIPGANIPNEKQSENSLEKLDVPNAIELNSSDWEIIKYFIFNEISFNYLEIVSYIDKLLHMWPFLKTQKDLNTIPIEQKIDLLVKNNKLELNAGKDIFKIFSYHLNYKDKINSIENKNELLNNHATTRRLIIYLKSLT